MARHRWVLLVAACLHGLNLAGQEKINQYDVNFKVGTNSEAHYPAGDQELYLYVYSNLKYSDEARAAKIQSNATISFNVQTDSTLSSLTAVSKLGYGIEEQIIELLQSLKFAPAIQNGMPAPTTLVMTFPITAH